MWEGGRTPKKLLFLQFFSLKIFISWLHAFITNRASFVMIEQVCLLRMIKVFIYPTVSYGSLGKGVMLIPLALGDARLNKNL